MNKPRIYLRELLHSDINEEYLTWFRDDEVTSFLEVQGNSLTKQLVEEYIDLGRNTGSYYMYAICLLEGDKHIGNLKVGPINQKHKIADLVCVIGDKSFWGKGLASEAIALGNTIAFNIHDIRKLHGQIYADNIGSVKAYSKAGWIIEGVIEGRYLKDDKAMDQILVSCHNPRYFANPGQTNYSSNKLSEWIKFRESFIQ